MTERVCEVPTCKAKDAKHVRLSMFDWRWYCQRCYQQAKRNKAKLGGV
jgi:hypothetical protein